MNAIRISLRAVALGVGVLASAAAALGQLPPAARAPVQPAAASADQLSFDQPLRWMYEAKTNYTAVKDYSCTLISKERVNGKLGDQQVMSMKVRTQPFSVYLRWMSPEQDKGQEVVYVQGKNNNKMRVKSRRTGILGFMSIDVNDPKVTQNSRHTIVEAGIGNMIEQTIKAWEMDRNSGKARALPPAQASYNNRPCTKIEVVHLENNGRDPYRSVIYLEKVSKMPIRLENYGWPQRGGAESGELLEEFSYAYIQFNTGLSDNDFNR